MKNKKGFTLIELVVVMAIIAVLSLLTIAAIAAARRSSVESQNRGNARTLEVAMESYAARNGGKYPAETADINTLLTGTLASYATSYEAGSCGNGGGGVVSTTSTFTITIYNSSCGGSIDTITH